MTGVWEQQSLWSQAADAAKRKVGRARTLSLLLGIAAAGLATGASQAMARDAHTGRVLAFLAAVAVGLVPLAAVRSGPTAVQEWTRLRSASEALKSEVYTFLARVGPYRADEAVRTLLARTGQITTDVADLAAHSAAHTPVVRVPPAVTGMDSYTAVRVAEQIRGYYRPHAALMARRAALVRRVEMGLASGAAVLGAVASVFGAGWASAWVAAITTVTAAVAAHSAAALYSYQQLEFARTAAELERLLANRAAADVREPVESADDAFVEACEQVISIQNEAWMAKWTAT